MKKGQGQFSRHVGFRIPLTWFNALRKVAKTHGLKDSKIYRLAFQGYLVNKGLLKKKTKKGK